MYIHQDRYVGLYIDIYVCRQRRNSLSLRVKKLNKLNNSEVE